MFGFGGPMGGLNGDPDYPDEGDYQGSTHYCYRRKRNDFVPDKWFYHKKVHVKIVHQTELAYLLEDSIGEYWVPKVLIHFGKKHTRQYSKFKVKYLKD